MHRKSIHKRQYCEGVSTVVPTQVQIVTRRICRQRVAMVPGCRRMVLAWYWVYSDLCSCVTGDRIAQPQQHATYVAALALEGHCLPQGTIVTLYYLGRCHTWS